MENLTYHLVLVTAFAALCANYAVAFDPSISRGEDGVVTIEFENHGIAVVSGTLSQTFHARVCAEDFGVIGPPPEDRASPPDSPAVLYPGDERPVPHQLVSRDDIPARSAEDGGPVRLGEQPVISGVYTAASVDKMLDDITSASPYTWLKTNECYVIYPRKGSLLMEKITVTVPPAPLPEVCESILTSRSAETAKEEPIHPGYLIIGPGTIPDPMKVSTLHTLTFVDTPLMEALCRVVESADPDAGDGLYIWQLCGGWARESRGLDPHWIPFGKEFLIDRH